MKISIGRHSSGEAPPARIKLFDSQDRREDKNAIKIRRKREKEKEGKKAKLTVARASPRRVASEAANHLCSALLCL